MNTETTIETNSFRFSGTSATTSDPDYIDDLINVEVSFSGEIECFEGRPIVCLNQVRKDIPGQTILIDSRDLYFKLRDFGQLLFTGIELFSVLTRQYVDAESMDSELKLETIRNCNHAINHLQNLASSLEATNETN